jgi:hypothetical protein
LIEVEARSVTSTVGASGNYARGAQGAAAFFFLFLSKREREEEAVGGERRWEGSIVHLREEEGEGGKRRGRAGAGEREGDASIAVEPSRVNDSQATREEGK